MGTSNAIRSFFPDWSLVLLPCFTSVSAFHPAKAFFLYRYLFIPYYNKYHNFRLHLFYQIYFQNIFQKALKFHEVSSPFCTLLLSPHFSSTVKVPLVMQRVLSTVMERLVSTMVMYWFQQIFFRRVLGCRAAFSSACSLVYTAFSIW